jgi:hypothetical protein
MSCLFTASENAKVWVKICGLTSLADAEAALEAGADPLPEEFPLYFCGCGFGYHFQIASGNHDRRRDRER